MNQNDLLNKPTSELMDKEATRQTAVIGYIIFSMAIIMILGIFICVKQAEIQTLRGKAHNDSLAVQSLKNNLLKY